MSIQIFKKAFGWPANKKLEELVEAHYLFPKEFFGKGKPYEDLLKSVGININYPRLLVWWDKATHGKNIVNYSKDIENAIDVAKNDVSKLITEISEVANKYGYETRF